jgi:biopolymer transport protein ExbD
MRRRKKVFQEESGLDLTPMLDIVFIMLIFFIVTTSFVKESGIEVNRPSAKQQKEMRREIFLLLSPKTMKFTLIEGRLNYELLDLISLG